MKCILKSCGNTIPKTRKRSATYCSDECYGEAKKDRSCERYWRLAAPAAEIKRCEQILAFLYDMQQLKKPINAGDLHSLDFNFTLSTNEHMDDKKRMIRIIGKVGYYIEPNKNLLIWKFKQNQ